MKNDSNSATEKIYKDLRMDILAGKIKSGTRLAESTLAKEKGVSRTPIREALQQLVKEELVYSIPRAGYIVQELSEPDIIDLFKTREAIELVAGLTAIQNISEREFKLLEENLFRTKTVVNEKRTENMIDLDAEFHEIIYKATRSKYLYRICMTLSDYTLKFRKYVIIVPEIAQRAMEDHFAIYEALKSKKSANVEKAIKSHLSVVKNDIIEHIVKLREESLWT